MTAADVILLVILIGTFALVALYLKKQADKRAESALLNDLNRQQIDDYAKHLVSLKNDSAKASQTFLESKAAYDEKWKRNVVRITGSHVAVKQPGSSDPTDDGKPTT